MRTLLTCLHTSKQILSQTRLFDIFRSSHVFERCEVHAVQIPTRSALRYMGQLQHRLGIGKLRRRQDRSAERQKSY